MQEFSAVLGNEILSILKSYPTVYLSLILLAFIGACVLFTKANKSLKQEQKRFDNSQSELKGRVDNLDGRFEEFGSRFESHLRTDHSISQNFLNRVSTSQDASREAKGLVINNFIGSGTNDLNLGINGYTSRSGQGKDDDEKR